MATAHADHARWLPPIAALIGGEVGFSSAGAGALGALVLLNLTTLTAAQVVGTDVVFGFTVFDHRWRVAPDRRSIRQGDHDQTHRGRSRGRVHWRDAVLNDSGASAPAGAQRVAGDSRPAVVLESPNLTDPLYVVGYLLSMRAPFVILCLFCRHWGLIRSRSPYSGCICVRRCLRPNRSGFRSG